MSAQRSSSSSYFRDCKFCGQKIHIREMRHGQWVAFDDAKSVHDCSNQSQYEDLEFPSQKPSNRRRSIYNVPASKPSTSYSRTGRQSNNGWKYLIGLLVLASFVGNILSSPKPAGNASRSKTTSGSRNVTSVSSAPAPTRTPRPRATVARRNARITTRIELKGYAFIYVQAEPSISAGEVGRIYDPGTEFEAIGLSPDTEWVHVRLGDGTEGWIMREFVIGGSALDTLPVHRP